MAASLARAAGTGAWCSTATCLAVVAMAARRSGSASSAARAAPKPDSSATTSASRPPAPKMPSAPCSVVSTGTP